MAGIVEGMEKNATMTEAPLAPVTIQRKVRTDLDETPLPKPCKFHSLRVLLHVF